MKTVLKGTQPRWWAHFVLALGIAALAGAQPETGPSEASSDKPPWEWTLEERVAHRYDLERIAERKKVYAQDLRDDGYENDALALEASPAIYQVLSGRENPELFLPKHLFDSLLRTAFSLNRESRLHFRKTFAERSQGIQPDESFWRDISVIASGLLAMEHRLKEVFGEMAVTQDPESRAALSTRAAEAQHGRCRALWTALEASRRHFGIEAFDRFLYEAVAPDQWVAAPADASFLPPEIAQEKLAESRRLALFRETGGCRDDL